MPALTLEQFLGHGKPTGSTSYLKNWKKRQPPQIDTWLHCKAPIMSFWQHGWPKVVEIKDQNGDKALEVWGGSWTCYEEEEILERMNFRDDDGNRKYPPTMCPHCLLGEWLRAQVEAGEMDWTTPVFRFAGDDPEKVITIHAGGFYGEFSRRSRKTLSKADADSLKKARIFVKDSWKEDCSARMSYVFAVVDNDNPRDGVVVATETRLLGDKVKEVISKEMMSADEDGNPALNPYCIRWIHSPNETDMKKKYDALKMARHRLTPEIKRLIVDTEPPDLARVCQRKDPALLRLQMEKYAVIDLPFDDLFGAVEQWWKKNRKAEQDKAESFEPEKYEREEQAAAAKKPARVAPPPPTATRVAAPAPKAQQPAEEWLCRECGELMQGGEDACTGCGAPRPRKPAARQQVAARPVPPSMRKPDPAPDNGVADALDDDDLPYG